MQEVLQSLFQGSYEEKVISIKEIKELNALILDKIENGVADSAIENIHKYLIYVESVDEDTYIEILRAITKKCDREKIDFIDRYLFKFEQDCAQLVSILQKQDKKKELEE
jgi:hypothetical protein